LGTEAHRRSCSTPPDTPGANAGQGRRDSNLSAAGSSFSAELSPINFAPFVPNSCAFRQARKMGLSARPRAGCCARPNGPWNQFHRRDLGTRVGRTLRPRCITTHLAPPAKRGLFSERFILGKLPEFGDRADSNAFRWQADAAASGWLGPLLSCSRAQNPAGGPDGVLFWAPVTQWRYAIHVQYPLLCQVVANTARHFL
jgi:hypothetical protein